MKNFWRARPLSLVPGDRAFEIGNDGVAGLEQWPDIAPEALRLSLMKHTRHQSTQHHVAHEGNTN